MEAWPSSISQAEDFQKEWAPRVVIRPLPSPPQEVVAVDADYEDNLACAAAVRFRLSPLALLEEKATFRVDPFPYVPGYFSLREGPALLAVLESLSTRPEVILVDGHGIAHPRRFGIACHLGVITNIPTIGCAKTRLLGKYREPGTEKGCWTPLEEDGMLLGAVVRTRSGAKPLFVSPGHLITLEQAVAIVLCCSTEFRIPDPLRRADQVARQRRAL